MINLICINLNHWIECFRMQINVMSFEVVEKLIVIFASLICLYRFLQSFDDIALKFLSF